MIVPTPVSTCLDYAARVSSIGFATELRLTSQASNPHVEFADGAFIGDYTQITIGSNGVAHAGWTDYRGRPGVNSANQDGYIASFLLIIPPGICSSRGSLAPPPTVNLPDYSLDPYIC